MNPKKAFSEHGTYVPSVYNPNKRKKRSPSDVEVKEVVSMSDASESDRLPKALCKTCDAPDHQKKTVKKMVWCVVRRSLLVLLTLVVLLVYAVFALCNTVANGPSPTVRNLLVLSALQASATKWVPALFLDESEVEMILADSKVISTDVLSLEEYTAAQMASNSQDGENAEPIDEWADAKDGMLFHTFSGGTYKAYVLVVKDPSRLYVGTSSDYNSGKTGARIFEMAEREGAVAIINGGEFADIGGTGTGDNPTGLTYSRGNCVWNDGYSWKTFIGFDKDNNLIVTEGMTREKADKLGIRDAVSFQTGNLLIDHDGTNIQLHYADSNTGTAQRTAIGQRADGAVIRLVTDGRTASSLGATHNDVIDIMVSYGAVTAGMLDAGSSSLMYYEDYYTKYDIDTTRLDEYQLQGLVNKYKAFTTPRRMPTFIMVAPETGEAEG